jgi:hypothetical protein
MSKVKELLEMTLPVFPSERRKLREQLEWEIQKVEFNQPKLDEDEEYEYWREMENERSAQLMEQHFNN